jgi:hypothetical protein
MAMTLQEMLDLLPDNDMGAITASDMRTIVTELFGYTTDVQQALNDGAVTTGQAIEDLDARVTALET